MTYNSVVMSSGHSKYCRGAAGVLEEVDEARRVVDSVANILRDRGVTVKTFHDDVSMSQDENLKRITDTHNGYTRDLDISVHLNANQQTDSPMGTEALFVTAGGLASEMSAAIAKAGGFKDRGAKKRTDLYVLNQTDMPCVLLEICFVDSSADAKLYEQNFERIVDSIATVLAGEDDEVDAPDRPERPPVSHEQAAVRLDIEVTGNVTVIINGVPIG
jgi:N-acetylmuramoyl-L-alanine amidase